MNTTETPLTFVEYMRRVAAGDMPGAPMMDHLGIRLTEVGEGRITITAELQPEFENGLGIAHGGFAATMLDTALSCAVNTVMPAGKVFTTLEMKINFIRPVTRASGTVSCTGHVVHAGSRTATAEGRITDADGKLYAHGTVTCILFRDTSGEAR
jgi:uncharacterized protein (TIGR00369 family)